MNRFQLYDDFGIIRTFATKVNALNWKCKRPELKLKIIPKEKPTPINFEEFEECLF